jgi:hypothetical protein
MARRADGGRAVLLLAVAVWGAAGCGDAPSRPRDPATATPAATVPAPAAPAPRPLTVGVTTFDLAINSWTRWGPRSLLSVRAFERATHTRAGVVMWYSDWARVTRPRVRQLRLVARRGGVPEITWEPWDARRPIHARQPAFSLRSIARGRHDALIRRWARALAAYGGPVRLRFAHEMNGTWYPWSEGVSANRRGDYVRAWRHVHDLFAAEGADEVIWVWSAVAGRPLRGFPGRAYVDALGVSGFVGGPHLRRRPWRSFDAAFGPTLDALERLAPGLPIEISEVGATERGGDRAAWVRGMFATLARRERVTSVNWFDLRQRGDWRIGTTRATLRAFAAGARAARRTRAAAAAQRVP